MRASLFWIAGFSRRPESREPDIRLSSGDSLVVTEVVHKARAYSPYGRPRDGRKEACSFTEHEQVHDSLSSESRQGMNGAGEARRLEDSSILLLINSTREPKAVKVIVDVSGMDSILNSLIHETID
jgi:hypothetical protein